MIIGIDIDDTVTYTTRTIKKYLKQEYPDYEEYKLLPKKEYIHFLKSHMKQMRIEYALKEGVKEAWEYFKEQHYKIIFITARNNKYYSESNKDTLEYLKQNGLFYDKIYFNEPKKGRRAHKNHVDLFIDDKEPILDNMAKYKIKGLCMGKSTKYPSFDNWYQIIDYLKEEQHGTGENTRCRSTRK